MNNYAHRGIPSAPANGRLNELLDGIRAEFEAQARASGEYEHSSMCEPFLFVDIRFAKKNIS